MGIMRQTLSAKSLIGDKVVNLAGEDLGKIEEIMIDVGTGQVAYAVLSFGGVLGIGDKLFALPWNRLRIDEGAKQFIVDVPKERLKTAPGFDKENWPDFSSAEGRRPIDNYYS